MKTLFQNGRILNVFTDSLETADVLVENGKILEVGSSLSAADEVIDITGKILCPGFIDSHIHIESSMLVPQELARVCLPHGTTAIVADPHEIANVCGAAGIQYMLEASKDLPMHIYIALPSCVPASPLDVGGAVMNAKDLLPFYQEKRVVSLGEMMNFPGVLMQNPDVMQKIADAKANGRRVNGHAPLVTGTALDAYIAAGISDDHECTSAPEAMERIRKGQRIMIRQGTAAQNVQALLPLFDEPWNHRCMLVTDDKRPADLLQHGHLDHIVRMAVQAGKSPFAAIRMASLQAAEYYGMDHVGAIAPGYQADMLVLSDLNTVAIDQVYIGGQLTAQQGEALPFPAPQISPELMQIVTNTCHCTPVTAEQFHLLPEKPCARVIRLIPHELLTESWVAPMDWDTHNGIDLKRDILKIAVIDRHQGSGRIAMGFINGLGFQRGAIAGTVSHDAHNLIVTGANEEDMALAANHIMEIGGGFAVVCDGKVLADMPLPIAGLMADTSAADSVAHDQRLHEAVQQLQPLPDVEAFMTMAFISLPVIPSIKLTSYGLVDVNKQEVISLQCEAEAQA